MFHYSNENLTGTRSIKRNMQILIFPKDKTYCILECFAERTSYGHYHSLFFENELLVTKGLWLFYSV